jgi:hypothetical protein
MSKVLEYIVVAVAGILAFAMLVTWAFSSYKRSLEMDCRELGQSRQGDLVIDCKVRKKEAPSNG